MIRHLLKLVWNRKRSTALLILEITCAFLVLFAVGTAMVFFIDSYREPLGYEYENVWNISVDMKVTGDDTFVEEQSRRMGRLLREATSIDGVESAAVSMLPAYGGGDMNGDWTIEGRYVYLHFDEVTDDFKDVMNLQVVSGRWFEPADGALEWQPVILDQDAAEAIYGTNDPIGRVFDKEANPPSRVVGVISEYRKNGELSGDNNFVFRRSEVDTSDTRPGRHILVRLRPGTTAQFEEVLQKRLAPVAGDWTLEIRSLREMRESKHRSQLVPVIVGGVIALFLVLMVALGLSGVLWQNVTQRRSELGLRRAAGATAAQVRRQILVELAIITSLGVLAGVIIVVQIPILGILADFGLPLTIFGSGVALALCMMFLLTYVCGLYPSWLATTIEPADALRAE